MVEKVVDRIKVSNEELPVILVGGGAVLLDSNKTLHGASKVIEPVCSDVANAVGAALSQISGTVDKVYSVKDYYDNQQLEFEIERIKENDSLNSLEKESKEAKIRKAYFERAREVVLKEAEEIAVSSAVLNGADRKTVNIVEKSDTSLSYIPGNATRIQIKAIGNLRLTSDVVNKVSEFLVPEEVINTEEEVESISETFSNQDNQMSIKTINDPYINNDGEWVLSESDIECIGIGAGILGCGGGGNPYLGKLMGTMAVREGKSIRVITPENLKRKVAKTIKNKEKQGLGIPIAMMGAPLIMKEKLVSRETYR